MLSTPDARTPCTIHDPELWFSTVRASQDKACRLCRSCPRVEQCLRDTLALERQLGETLHGVHAGTTRADRQRVLMAGA